MCIDVKFYEYVEGSKYNKYINIIGINYLSRDILFVGYPSDSVEYGRGIVEFLEEYINPKGSKYDDDNNNNIVSKIPRCGVIREAINVNLDDNFN